MVVEGETRQLRSDLKRVQSSPCCLESDSRSMGKASHTTAMDSTATKR